MGRGQDRQADQLALDLFCHPKEGKERVAYGTALYPTLIPAFHTQDLLVASLFRNFLLAERIMSAAGCTPISYPRSERHHPCESFSTWWRL
jgi:hypothetical protein